MAGDFGLSCCCCCLLAKSLCRFVDFDVTDTAGRKAEDGHWRTGMDLVFVCCCLRIERDERLEAVTLHTPRFAATIGQYFARSVYIATDINGHTLREVVRLNDHPPSSVSVLRHLRRDEPQFRIARTFFPVSRPGPRRSFGTCRRRRLLLLTYDGVDSVCSSVTVSQRVVILRHLCVHLTHHIVTLVHRLFYRLPW